MFRIIVFICFSFSLAARYQDLRENFKKNLYNEQYGLMRHDEYMEFIEPHIARTEKLLKVHPFLVKNSEHQVSIDYFNCLLQYNLAYFHYHVNDTSKNKEAVQVIRNQLLGLIRKINTLAVYETFDAQQEFKTTIESFHTSTKEYYKKLNRAIKLVLSLAGITYVAPKA